MMDYDELELALSASGSGADAPDPCRPTADALAEVAAGTRPLRAVRHPLGFLCLPLLREGPRGICVHLFGAGYGTGRDAEPWHAHSWELRSHVLFGSVTNVPVRVSRAAGRPTHRVFEVHSGPGQVDEIVPTAALVRGEPGFGRVNGPGETYTLPAGEFHATCTDGRTPAATVVLGRTVPGGTDLSLGPLDGPARTMTRALCDEERTAEAARAALRRIDEHISA